MKRIAKFMSVLLALMMVFTAAPVFAEGNTYTVKILANTDNHSYTAYQIFKGNVDKDGNLTDIKFGDNVNGDALIEFLNDKYQANLKPSHGSQKVDAAAVAAFIDSKFETNTTGIADFVNALVDAEVITGKGFPSDSKVDQNDEGDWVYSIPNLPSGYYLIKDNGATVAENPGDNFVKSAFILRAVGNNQELEVVAKADVPKVDKDVQGPGDEKPGNWTDANIGDSVTFNLTANLPAKSVYEKYTEGYKLIFHDTLSKGLTVTDEQRKALTVTFIDVEGTKTPLMEASPTEPSATDKYHVFYDKEKNTLDITFLNLKKVPNIQEKIDSGAKIVVTYQATLNENAVLAPGSETNNVYLEYSNDPVSDQTGKTPEDVVYVYNYGFGVIKKDGNEEKFLPGAEFELSRDGQVYYFQLVTADDQEPTKPEPGLPEESEMDNSAVYKVVGHATPGSDYKVPEGATTKLTTPPSGKFVIVGLDQGTYTLKETQAPNGYNKPVAGYDTFEITVDPVEYPGTDDVKWTMVNHTILNHKIPAMPETGGTGTKIFMAVGGVILVAGVVMLVAKKKREQA